MFPQEFADLLNARGRKLLDGPARFEAFHRRGRTPIVLLEGLIEPRVSRRCIEALDAGMYARLRRMETPIPRERLLKQKKNYGESLEKTVRVKTVTLNSARSKALDAAQEIGLGQMMRSESFRRFAEVVVGRPLRQDHWGRQVICYEQGDYSGPHNDHHPESEVAGKGFVDLHIMFSNAAVQSQWLVYEEGGFLSRSHEVAMSGSIAVYRLPFWHYTTPLVPKRGRETEARRWLLLGSFDFDPPMERLVYR
jgi:hypothetical protein